MSKELIDATLSVKQWLVLDCLQQRGRRTARIIGEAIGERTSVVVAVLLTLERRRIVERMVLEKSERTSGRERYLWNVVGMHASGCDPILGPMDRENGWRAKGEAAIREEMERALERRFAKRSQVA